MIRIKNLFLITLLSFSSLCVGQQLKTTKTYLPISIYTTTSSIQTLDIFSNQHINKKLNFSKFTFTFVSFEDIDNGRFLISDTNLSAKATRFIYDDYKSYRDENLLKGFLQKHDLTRWQVCQFLVSPVQ